MLPISNSNASIRASRGYMRDTSDSYYRIPSPTLSTSPEWKPTVRLSQRFNIKAAARQMAYLCISPKRIYRDVYYHKQTKNSWARDDPSLVVLLSASLLLVAFAWSALYAGQPFRTAVFFAVKTLTLHFAFTGAAISTAMYYMINTFLTHTAHTHAIGQRVEWRYAFDIHVNSFVPLFMQLYVVQLILAPLVLRHNNWVVLCIGNTLYFSACAQYIYTTYLGYNALPFVIRSELLLFPIILLFASYIVSLLGLNVARVVLSYVF